MPVDAQHVARVPFEKHFEVGGAGVASGEGGEDAAFGGQHRQAPALLGWQGGGPFRGDVVGHEAGFDRHCDGVRGERCADCLGECVRTGAA